MTTIAANRRCMSGDTKVTGEHTAIYYTDKVFRIGESIVGVAGTVGATTKWLAWFRKGCPEVDEIGFGEDEELAAMVLNEDGLFYYTAMAEPDRLHRRFYSVGSGSMTAMGMLGLGKTPAEAVREAAKYDEGTGGRITTLSLSEFRKSKTKTKFQKPTKRPKAAAPPEPVQAAKIQVSNTELT